MKKPSNLQIIEQLYKDFESGNIPAILARFDNDIEWVRPGSPYIPFSGNFKGIHNVIEMFKIQAAELKIKTFVHKKICGSDDTIVVLGCDEVDVVKTGKSYITEWAQSFTFKDGKIIHVYAYIDSKAIADAFIP